MNSVLKLLLSTALCACAPNASPSGADTIAMDSQAMSDTAPGVGSATDAGAAPAVLIDSLIPPAIAGEEGWNFQQSTETDLNGDGESEKVVLTARVEMYRGQPAWDDGQPWQVYIETRQGVRTYLYAQRLQLGTLTMRLTESDPGKSPSIILLEQLPHMLRVIEAWYPSPAGLPVTAVRFERRLDARGDIASPKFR